ncbi:nuclease-related domain-containing protein [Paracerasibacillus soli]|uniref:Nuclease-related domain-containing protein n=1 Tax=Paracerasibacillus soli TaxID=480284 RepID=A0ABU5CNE6_9BACI|nr:nuclease-related domain-containing protein [Virgibacillus soli]MDY0407882.1 nuclease-related domain-containing protein [Virgibacillus soli]
MFYKSQTKSKELITLELLDKRMTLPTDNKRYYLNLKKGYEGEMLFDSHMGKLQCECLILNDLLLKFNNNTFQLDSLMIAQGQINVYEVKNQEGDFYYEEEKFYKKPRIETINPLHQLSRSESLLRQLLLSLGYKLQINASVVFVNPNFTLYQAPLDKPIIFPTQLDQYMNHLNAIPSRLTENHKRLADQLLASHITDSPFSKLPSYDYNQLRKGITCSECRSFSALTTKKKYICNTCQHQELLNDAVLRNIKEFRFLFPEKR